MELPVSAYLTDWVRRLVDDEAAVQSALETPVLVWEGDLADTRWVIKPPEHSPSPENPVVFLVKKVEGRPNPFGGGVTLGRAEHNDVVFPHASVSRFHAYLAPDPTRDLPLDAGRCGEPERDAAQRRAAAAQRRRPAGLGHPGQRGGDVPDVSVARRRFSAG